MEARQTFRGSAVPKGLLVALAMCAALGLAVAGSIIAKDHSSSSAVTSPVHAAPGTVLRQDNPVQASQPAAAPTRHATRSAGNQ